MKLYDYFRSSAAYRVRIALDSRDSRPSSAFVHLRKGEQRAADYLALNPQGARAGAGRPTTATCSRNRSRSSSSWTRRHPEPPLLPRDAADALAGARDRAGDRLRHPSAQQPARAALPQAHARRRARTQKDAWYRHWIDVGLERARDAARARAGDRPLLPRRHADARRLSVSSRSSPTRGAWTFRLAPYPTLHRIEAACHALPAFAAAAPERQPDAE